MSEKQEIKKNIALPYYVSVDTINKLMDAIKRKAGDEVSIKGIFGEGKYANCKSALLSFGIITNNMQFTPFGKTIAYAIDEQQKKDAWKKVIKSISAYDDFLIYFQLNKKGISTCELDIVKNYWGSRDICKSDQMRNDASITFGYILSLAGLGEYRKGKQGTSRIEFYLDELNKYCEIDNFVATNDEVQDTNKNENPKQSNTETFSMPINYKSIELSQNKQINVNITINVNSVEELKEVLDCLKND